MIKTIGLNESEITKLLDSCYKFKPEDLIISELKWKTIIYTILTGGNLLITGESGSGKTKTILSLLNLLDRKLFNIPLGASQDPISSIIGNTHFNSTDGTFFNKSYFVNSIQEENAIILLDEITRPNKEVWNVLMSVLDEEQRFLRVDDDINTPEIKVGNGVCFLATANIGKAYTSTKILDKAFKERFTVIEMDLLNKEQETKLQMQLYPELDFKIINDICSLACLTREENDDIEISRKISTKDVKRFLHKIKFNFTFVEAFQIEILSKYDNSEEINFLKQLLDSYNY
jgi:MoxR-like ATPase